MRLHRQAFVLAGIAGLVGANAQITVPSDGSDGAFNKIGEHVELDLSQAVTASWNTPAPIPGKGVYDPVQWAVVYKFSSFNFVGGGHRLTFKPHPSGAPVVFLVQTTFSCSGVNIDLYGGNHNGLALALPGPGGFRGGAGAGSFLGSAGFGPDGADYQVNTDLPGGGSYGTAGVTTSGPIYGNARILPLIGGSGGSGRFAHGHGGGGGGGAILIAAQNSITLTGSHINAYGGVTVWQYGGGAGGAVKLVSDIVNVDANSQINANGNSGGGHGRVRIEGNSRTLNGAIVPPPSSVNAGTTPQIWPDSTTPLLSIVSIDGINSPADPRANLAQPDIEFSAGGNKNVVVHAYNVPIDGTWSVQVRMTPRNGKESFVTCTYVSGNQASSMWQGTLNFDEGAAALIARAFKL